MLYSAPNLIESPAIENAPRPRVLIVDDSPVALAVLEAVFIGEQYDVVTAGNGLAGFEQARQTVPDLLVTDGLMPEVDGFELLRMLKEHPATRGIPVIMLTSAEIGDAEFQSRQPRPDAFIVKSPEMAPLLGCVKDLLSARSRSR